ncbi:MAG: hypothetical protein R8G66_11335 [Cytophagales bacterium]|nr:hypothetical protein [Cytophagales bacterium]
MEYDLLAYSKSIYEKELKSGKFELLIISLTDMKKITSPVIITCFLAFALLITSCSGTKEDRRLDQLNKEKEELTGKFESIGADLDQAIEELDTKIASEKGRTKRRLEKAKKELLKTKKDINASMKEVAEASDENWENIKKQTDDLLKDVDVDLSGLKQKINSVMDELTDELKD